MQQRERKVLCFPRKYRALHIKYMDKQSDLLLFPTIYCAKTRVDNKERTTPVHYSTVCKWQLRSQDRRVAQSVPNSCYKLKKLQISKFRILQVSL